MRLSLIPHLACPDCDANLAVTDPAAGDVIVDGALGCTACSRCFPIAGGIASLMPKALLPDQESEIAARDAQVSDYDAMWYLNLFGAFEIPMTLWRLDIGEGDFVLEAGGGTGRMTPKIAAKAGSMVSVDFSLESLRANGRKLAKLGVDNVDLIQADLCHLPFQAGVFDRILSCQVLEHVPGDEARSKAVAGISRTGKEGATVVISAYQHSVFTREKHGKHDGGIPFFRFTRGEFRDLLASRMEVRSITGKLVYLYLAHCVTPSSGRPSAALPLTYSGAVSSLATTPDAEKV